MIPNNAANLVTGPGYAFTLADARAQLKNEGESFDDSLVQLLIKSAASIAQNKTNRAFMQSTFMLCLSEWPYDDFVTLYPSPLVKIQHIKYYAKDSNELTDLPTSDYRVYTSFVPGKIEFIADTLPSLEEREDAVQITFVAGYGNDGDSETQQQTAIAEKAPDVISWMKLNMATLYEVRQLILQGQSIQNISTYADSLIYPYII